MPGSITPVDGKRNVSTADFKLVGTEGRDGSFTPYTGAQQVRPGVIADTKYNQAIPGGTTTTYKADATNSRTGNGVSVSGAVSAKVAKSPSEAQNIAEGIGSRIDTDTLGRSPQFRQVSESCSVIQPPSLLATWAGQAAVSKPRWGLFRAASTQLQMPAGRPIPT